MENYQALRNSVPCLSRAATPPKGTKLELGRSAHLETLSSANHTTTTFQPTGRITKAASWLHLSRVSPALHPPEIPSHTHTPKQGFGGRGHLWKAVATHRFRELKHLRAVEKLTTWRRSYGFDRCDARDEQWVHGPLPPTPEQTTANVWAELNALTYTVSISGKYRSRQIVDSFIAELEQGTAGFTNEEFARLKRIVKRKDHDAAHVVATPIDTAQP